MNDRTRNELDHIQSLRLPELQALFREVLGEETRCPNRGYLLRRIGEALEAREEADASHEPPSGGGGGCAGGWLIRFLTKRTLRAIFAENRNAAHAS